jgi:hypothetical protein
MHPFVPTLSDSRFPPLRLCVRPLSLPFPSLGNLRNLRNLRMALGSRTNRNARDDHIWPQTADPLWRGQLWSSLVFLGAPEGVLGNPDYPDRIYFRIYSQVSKTVKAASAGIKFRASGTQKASKPCKKALAHLNIWSKNGPGASAKADLSPRGVSKVGNFTQSCIL